MADEIVERVKLVADHIIKNGATVRETADYISNVLKTPVSKTTIDKDINERLIKISPMLFSEVKKVLADNQSNRTYKSTETWHKKSYEYTIKNRLKVLEIAKYMIETRQSIDETSKYFLSIKGNVEGYSKKTIYNDMIIRLPLIDQKLATEVLKIFKSNNSSIKELENDKTI